MRASLLSSLFTHSLLITYYRTFAWILLGYNSTYVLEEHSRDIFTTNFILSHALDLQLHLDVLLFMAVPISTSPSMRRSSHTLKRRDFMRKKGKIP